MSVRARDMTQSSRRYHDYRGAGLRLGEPLAPDLAAGLPVFARVGPLGVGVHAFDLAQVIVLLEAGLISRPEARRMRDALRRLEPGVVSARDRLGGGLHSGERLLVRRLGLQLGGRLHTGRSSWDVETAATRFVLRDVVLDVIVGLLDWREALLRTARNHVRTVMPFFTHGQIAAPTTFAHVLHAHAAAASRHTGRLFDAYRRINVSPAGAAAGVGAPFGLSDRRLAVLLGFDRVQPNTLDAVHSQDDILELLAAMASVARSLESFGTDLVLWSGERLQYVKLADRHCHTSSIMPQKRNPEGGMQLQAVGRFAVSRLTGGSAADLWEVVDRVQMGLRVARAVLAGLRVNRMRMRDDLVQSWACATMVAASLVRWYGLAWREAHQIVGLAVRTAEARGESAPSGRTCGDLRRAARELLHVDLAISESVVAKSLSPERVVAAHRSAGGPAPRSMARAVTAGLALVQRDRAVVRRLRARVIRAAARLRRALDAL